MHFTIIAGEESGDLLGGPLVKALKDIDPTLIVDGIGGSSMRNAGINTLFGIDQTAVMGLFEVLRHYPSLHNILSTIRQHIRTTRPDLVILIDYPEFNLKVAESASRLGIPVLYYVSPQVWAWRKGRIKKIKRWVNLIAVLFPFEKQFYQRHQVPSRLVRHPLLDHMQSVAKSPVELSQHSTIRIALLPGSRRSEIRRILPAMLTAAGKIRSQFPQATFVIPLAPSLTSADIAPLDSDLEQYVKIVQQTLDTACAECDLSIVASGTATLHIAMLGLPMIIVYKVSPITYWLLKPLIRLKNFGLANIVLGESVYTELLQSEASSTRILAEAARLITSRSLRSAQRNCGLRIREKLDQGLTAEQLAAEAYQLAKDRYVSLQ